MNRVGQGARGKATASRKRVSALKGCSPVPGGSASIRGFLHKIKGCDSPNAPQGALL